MFIEALEKRSLLAASFTVSDPVNVSKLAGNQSESSIAIDPTNPSHLFIASNTDDVGLFSAYSTNGGATWTKKIIADGTDNLIKASSDPSAAFDSFGNLFLSYL